MGPLDEDLDALWARDKSTAFLQKVNSLNTPHKVNDVRLISCCHSPLNPLVTRLEIKASASGAGKWQGRTGLGPGLCPLGPNFRQVGEICQARAAQSPQLPDRQIPNQTHTYTERIRETPSHPSNPADVFKRLLWSFLGKLEHITLNLNNRKP